MAKASKAPAVDPEIQTRLSARAWELAEEAMTYGRLTITDPDTQERKTMTLDEAVMIRHVQWAANLSARKRPRTSMPSNADDVLLSESR